MEKRSSKVRISS